jgi:hypothetical protein
MALLRRIRYLDAVVVVCLFAALLFVSPAIFLWTRAGTPWFVPYLLWLLVIGLAAWAWRQRSRHDV